MHGRTVGGLRSADRCKDRVDGRDHGHGMTCATPVADSGLLPEKGANSDLWIMADPLLHRRIRMTEDSMTQGGCPVAHGSAAHPTQGGGNRQWWPNRLNLKVLHK